MAKRKKLGSPSPGTLKYSTTRKTHALPPLAQSQKSQSHNPSPGKPSGGTLYLPKMLIGHRDSAVDFYMNTLAGMMELPDDQRPGTIIISDPLHGSENSGKLTQKHIDTELKHATELLEKAIETGANIIYDMSHDNRLADHFHLTNEAVEEA